MKSKAIELLGLVPLMCLCALSATAAAEVRNRVLITNPAVLESMGFPRDATNVYQAVSAGRKGVSEAGPTGDFGTASQFTGIPPKSFVGRQNTAAGPWEYNGGVEGCCANLSRTGTEVFADAPLHLPHGALLEFVRFWANDVNVADDMDFFLFESCFPLFGAGATSYTTLIDTGDLSTTGSTGNQSNAVGVSATIDNRLCAYTLRVAFRDTTGLTLQKLRAQWVRQISPAPGAATFGDVPLAHPQFQVIEALAASGITGGCGGGNFCPGDFVTREQVAAFFARALGL